jgi:hypothetical protein
MKSLLNRDESIAEEMKVLLNGEESIAEQR